MSMITCKECGKEFSNRADKCPSCGTLTRISMPYGVPCVGTPEQVQKSPGMSR